MIPFYRPHLTGQEQSHLEESLATGHWRADGPFSEKCCRILRERTNSPVYLTSSATHALELALMALNLHPGDEVIVPSFTFVSTANAVVMNGLTPVFVDIREDTLNIDEKLIERAITQRTRAVIPVHYAGVACEMESINALAKRFRLAVIEDAAHGVNAFYKERALGSWGDLGVFSFHQTKNLTCGEGGTVVVANEQLIKRIEIHRQKGTDRSRFLLGQIDKYSWIDRGSNYQLSDILAAFLYAQLQAMDEITEKRRILYMSYLENLGPIARGRFRLPVIPEACRSNYHIFHILMENQLERDRLKTYLADQGVETATHFVPLHSSPGGKKFGVVRGRMEVTDMAAGCLLRLPLYPDLTREEQDHILRCFGAFFK